MWAASSAEAMLRGEGTPILGELHPGVTPFTTLSVLAHAPDREGLERDWREDFGEDQISPEIGDGAILAANAVLKKGTIIGPGEIWGGVPAKKIGVRGEKPTEPVPVA